METKMNYLVRNATKSSLGRGIICCELDGGVLFEDTFLLPVLAALRSEIAEQSATQYDGVVELKLRPATGAATTPVERPAVDVAAASEWFSYSGRKPDDFVKIIRETLAPALGGREIVAHNSDKKPRPQVPADGRFHVFIGHGRPSGKAGSHFKVFGVELGDYSKFVPEGSGRVVVDPETATPIFQVEENAVWVLLNCAYYGGHPPEYRVFRKICEEIVWDVTTTPEQKAERVEREARERRTRSRDQYVRECARRFEKTVHGTKESISRGHADMKSLQDQLVRRIRETQGAERKLVQLEASRPTATEGYGKEFDKLMTVPKVRDVRVADGVVKIFTEVLYCVDPRTKIKHEIGAFRIDLYTTHCEVRWNNLTRKVDGYWGGANAPHVDGSGKACLGTMAEILPDLVGNYEFAALAMVAIQFVESVNVDDAAGKKINNWPVAT